MSSFMEIFSRRYWDYVSCTAATVGGTSGIAVADLVEVPQGYMAKLARYSVYSNSSATPAFELFRYNGRNIWKAAGFSFDRTLRIDYTSAGTNNVSDNSSPGYLGEGEVAVFAWTGCTNGDVCQASVLIELYELIPMMGQRSVAAIHHQEQVEDQMREHARVVGGSGWQPAETAHGLEEDGLAPWSSRDPADAADDPSQPYLAPGMGQYVGGNALGTPQAATPPFRGQE